MTTESESEPTLLDLDDELESELQEALFEEQQSWTDAGKLLEEVAFNLDDLLVEGNTDEVATQVGVALIQLRILDVTALRLAAALPVDLPCGTMPLSPLVPPRNASWRWWLPSTDPEDYLEDDWRDEDLVEAQSQAHAARLGNRPVRIGDHLMAWIQNTADFVSSIGDPNLAPSALDDASAVITEAVKMIENLHELWVEAYHDADAN